MARVLIPGAVPVPAPGAIRGIAPAYREPIERRTFSPALEPEIRRSIPARIAAAALVTSVGVTMTAVALVVFFDLNLFMLVSRIFGANTMTFLASLATDAGASATATAASSVAAAGTATGIAVVGSFAAGMVAATAALRAAASASRKAA